MRKYIEREKLVRDSIIWNMGENYYKEKGLEAFSKGSVPDGITSNTAIAGAYANIINEFFKDIQNHGNQEEIIILEIGGGNGKLALRILSSLIHKYLPLHKIKPKFKYLLTDGASKNRDSWQQIKKMEPFIKKGILDFGLLLVGKEFEIDTIHSGIIKEETLGSKPIIIVSNYLFCSIPGDVVKVENGYIYEQLASVYEKELEKDEESELFDRIKCKLKDGQALIPPYTKHPFVNKVLDEYKSQLKKAYIPFSLPSVWFSEIFLKRNAPLLFLYGDLAFSHLSTFRRKTPLIHNKGYFATYTNLHLLAELFKSYGGKSIIQENPNPHFQIAALMKKSSDGKELVRTELVSEIILNECSPSDLHNVKKLLAHYKGENIQEKEIHSWLRLSNYDPKIAMICISYLDKCFQEKKKLDLRQLQEALFRVSIYIYPNDKDTASLYEQMALIFIKTKLFEDALNIINQAINEQGATVKQLYYKSLVLSLLGKKDESKQTLTDLLAQEPSYEPALQLSMAIEQQ